MCRSPLGERLAASLVRDTLGPVDASEWRFASAGTDARPGQTMESRSAQTLRRLGGDDTGFRSRPLAVGEAMNYDLVLTMSRRHRRMVLKQDPRAMRRTFTLLEARDLLTSIDERALRPLPLPMRAREFPRLLDAARAFRDVTPADDIPDPIGRPQSVHDEVGSMIARALNPLMDVLLTPVELQGPFRRPSVGNIA
jgi:protein-tyrosine phosphatase